LYQIRKSAENYGVFGVKSTSGRTKTKEVMRSAAAASQLYEAEQEQPASASRSPNYVFDDCDDFSDCCYHRYSVLSVLSALAPAL
jgi:hypothetical protein